MWVRWARAGLEYLARTGDQASSALGHFLLGAGMLRIGQDDEAEAELAVAAQAATTHGLASLAARNAFLRGNLAAQRGDIAAARTAMQETIGRAQAAREPFQEALGRNNAAYYAVLAGDLAAARSEIDAGLALAETWVLDVPRQWLFSTRGEIALAENQPQAAEDWSRRGLAVAERYGNAVQTANYRANLGLAAQRQCDLDGALQLLEQARAEAAPLSATYLQIAIDLWLVELLLARGERTAANNALERARQQLATTPYPQLQAHAEQIAQAFSSVPSVSILAPVFLSSCLLSPCLLTITQGESRQDCYGMCFGRRCRQARRVSSS